jgi:hypothetical protein
MHVCMYATYILTHLQIYHRFNLCTFACSNQTDICTHIDSSIFARIHVLNHTYIRTHTSVHMCMPYTHTYTHHHQINQPRIARIELTNLIAHMCVPLTRNTRIHTQPVSPHTNLHALHIHNTHTHTSVHMCMPLTRPEVPRSIITELSRVHLVGDQLPEVTRLIDSGIVMNCLSALLCQHRPFACIRPV